MKKISAILTTYNSEKSIQAVIDSILQQAGVGEVFELELIAVDDCSKDRTAEILKRNDLIFLSTSKNTGGPNTGRNMGLKIATGDFICIADHDDEWKQNKVISMLPFFEKAPIVTSGYTVIDTQNNTSSERINQENRSGESFVFYKKNKTFLNKLIRSKKGQQTYLGSIMYDSVLKNILFEEEFGMVDFDWVLRLFYQQNSIEVCASLYNRYVEGHNLSLNENYRKKDFQYSMLAMKEYQNEFPKEVRIGKKRLHGSLARYYYLMDQMQKARTYFLKSNWNVKTLLYFLTTFWGASYVKKRFNVFG